MQRFHYNLSPPGTTLVNGDGCDNWLIYQDHRTISLIAKSPPSNTTGSVEIDWNWSCEHRWAQSDHSEGWFFVGEPPDKPGWEYVGVVGAQPTWHQDWFNPDIWPGVITPWIKTKQLKWPALGTSKEASSTSKQNNQRLWCRGRTQDFPTSPNKTRPKISEHLICRNV